jgi:GNAT superfamily N-acetyltransferase
VLDATWPPASTREAAGWTRRDGAGGGKRVSAATAGPEARAENAPALVQIRPWDTDLAAALDRFGYRVVDETVLYLAPTSALTAPLPHASAYWTDRRLAVIEEIWAAGGIGPARLAVMDRVAGPKAYLLVRAGDRAAAAGFVAVADGIAMVHAVEVLAPLRRHGAGRQAIRAAANWAARRGAACHSGRSTRHCPRRA